MKPKQTVILMAIVLFLNFTGQTEAAEGKAVSWITQKEAA